MLLLYKNPFLFNISNFLRTQVNEKRPSYALKTECVPVYIEMYFIVCLLKGICYITNSAANLDAHAWAHIALVFKSVN